MDRGFLCQLAAVPENSPKHIYLTDIDVAKKVYSFQQGKRKKDTWFKHWRKEKKKSMKKKKGMKKKKRYKAVNFPVRMGTL